MSATEIVIVGGGAGARFTADILRASGRRVKGYLDDRLAPASDVNGAPVLGAFSMLDDASFVRDREFILAFADFKGRRTIAEKIRKSGGRLANAIHPKAEIAPSAKLGENVVVNAFSLVHPGAIVGDLVLVEGHCSIGVDNRIGNNVLFATGIMLNGSVVIEDDVFLGSGVIVIPGKTVGRGALIGAGATVVSDIPPNKVAVGTPARVVRENN
ncbi:MAG: NeuD/PglB/VioB family sugar acetyltransferase [Rhodospirillales bacterium]|nr:NeuD/PglB/VioB family sugar acetyltransferase [Rhodospirillales bacterium]